MILTTFFVHFKFLFSVHRKNTSQTGLYALRWSTVLVEGALKAPEDVLDYNTLVLAQANLLAVVTAYGDKKKNEKGYSLVSTYFNNVKLYLLSKLKIIILTCEIQKIQFSLNSFVVII